MDGPCSHPFLPNDEVVAMDVTRFPGFALLFLHQAPPLVLLGFWQNIAVIMAKVSPNKNTPEGTIAG